MSHKSMTPVRYVRLRTLGCPLKAAFSSLPRSPSLLLLLSHHRQRTITTTLQDIHRHGCLLALFVLFQLVDFSRQHSFSRFPVKPPHSTSQPLRASFPRASELKSSLEQL